MTQLSDLIHQTLPLNRKERFFTGTVFPMIVCKDNFKHFNRLLPLVGLADLNVEGIKWGVGNMVFYTEYSLKESLVTERDKKRFDIPKSKDTPDIVIYLREPKPVIIALEAKVFNNSPAAKLRKQMKRQWKFLEAMKKELNADCHHYALIPQALYDSYKGSFKGKVLTWDALAQAYEATGPDYFLDMLNLSLDRYNELVSKPSTPGKNSDGFRTGMELLRAFKNNDSLVQSVGRAGGLEGTAFAEDIKCGSWKIQRYEYSAERHEKTNWFTIQEFVEAVGTEV